MLVILLGEREGLEGMITCITRSTSKTGKKLRGSVYEILLGFFYLLYQSYLLIFLSTNLQILPLLHEKSC